MGINLGGGASSSSSRSAESQSPLASTQHRILKKREAQYQSLIFPQLRADIQGSRGPMALNPLLRSGAEGVSQSFAGGRETVQRDMARRGLAGTGVETAGLGMLASAKSSALSDAYMKALIAREDSRRQLLQMGGALSPTPVQAAPTLTQQGSKSSSWNMSGGIGI